MPTRDLIFIGPYKDEAKKDAIMRFVRRNGYVTTGELVEWAARFFYNSFDKAKRQLVNQGLLIRKEVEKYPHLVPRNTKQKFIYFPVGSDYVNKM